MTRPTDPDRRSWHALVLRLPRRHADELAAELAALGRGVESRTIDARDEELRAFLPDPARAGSLSGWAEGRLATLGVEPGAYSFRIEEVEDGHWVERYQESLQPFEFASGFTVHPRGRVEVEDGRHPLLLVPGRAFGTGEHATTQLCAGQLEKRVRPGQSWADLGCGTGILLVVARAAGAGRLRGVEIDVDAVEVARHVLEANGVVSDSEIVHGGLEQVADEGWDGVICNISTTFVRMHVAALAALPRPGGLLMISGVLREDLSELAESFSGHGLRELEREERDPWAVLVLERS